jgi:hypothetical protein
MKDGHLTRIYTFEAADITLRFLFVSSLFPIVSCRLLLSLFLTAAIAYTAVVCFSVSDVVYRTVIFVATFTYGSFNHTSI